MKTQRYVIMLGQVFLWEGKAPFVESGKSVWGALEYDKEAEKVRCHECGEWHRNLGYHLRIHGLSPREYKVKHRLNISSRLLGPNAHKERAAKTITCNNFRKPEVIARAVAARAKRTEYTRNSAEQVNVSGTCPVQWPAVVRDEALRLGRTPTSTEVPGKIRDAAIRAYGTWTSAMANLGLDPVHGPGRGKPKRYTAAVLIEVLRDFYVLNQRLPKMREYGIGRLPSKANFHHEFGGFPEAYAAAGLAKVAEERKAA